MAYSQSDLDRLEKAIASGRKSVTLSDGRTVVYHSLRELMDARDKVAASLTSPNRQTFFLSSVRKG